MSNVSKYDPGNGGRPATERLNSHAARDRVSEFLTVAHAAQLFGVDTSTITRWYARDYRRFRRCWLRLGPRQLRAKREDLVAWAEAGRGLLVGQQSAPEHVRTKHAQEKGAQ